MNRIALTILYNMAVNQRNRLADCLSLATVASAVGLLDAREGIESVISDYLVDNTLNFHQWYRAVNHADNAIVTFNRERGL